jgi:hypothetical protein
MIKHFYKNKILYDNSNLKKYINETLNKSIQRIIENDKEKKTSETIKKYIYNNKNLNNKNIDENVNNKITLYGNNYINIFLSITFITIMLYKKYK